MPQADSTCSTSMSTETLQNRQIRALGYKPHDLVPPSVLTLAAMKPIVDFDMIFDDKEGPARLKADFKSLTAHTAELLKLMDQLRMQKSIEDQERELTLVTEAIEKAQQHRQSASIEVTSLEKTRDDLLETTKALSLRHSNKVQCWASLNEALGKANSELWSLLDDPHDGQTTQDDPAGMSTSIAQLTRRVKQRVETLTHQKRDMAGEVESLRGDNAKQQEDHSLAKDGFQSSLDKCQGTIAELEGQISTASGNIRELDEKLQSREAKVTDLVKDNGTLLSQVNNLGAEKQELEAARARDDREKAELARDLEQKGIEHRQLETAFNNADSEFNSEKATFLLERQKNLRLQNQYATSTRLLRTLRQQCVRLRSELSDTQLQDPAEAEEPADLPTESQRTSEALLSLVACFRRFRTRQATTLSGRDLDVNRLARAVDNESTKRKQAEEELQKLRADLQSYANMMTEHQDCVGKLQQRETDLKNRLRLVAEEKSGVQRTLDASVLSCASTEQANKKLQQELEGCQSSLVKIKEELKKTKGSLSEVKTRFENSKQSVSNLQAELHLRQDSLAGMQTELQSSRDSLTDVKRESEKSKQSVTNMQTELQSSRDSLNQTQQELADSRVSLNGIRRELDSSQRSIVELEESQRTAEALYDGNLQKKDYTIQELQRRLDEACHERDELRQAQLTRDQSDARVRETAGNQESQSTWQEWMRRMEDRLNSNLARQSTNADTLSRSTGQAEADPPSSRNNDGNNGDPGQSRGDGSRPDGGQGKRKPDAPLQKGNGKRARQSTDSGPGNPPAGSVVFNVVDFMTGNLQLPIPEHIAEQLRQQITKWRRNPDIWNKKMNTRKPACIESRYSKKPTKWSHEIDKACDHCFTSKKLCVTWISEEELRLLPAAGLAGDEEEGIRWIR